MVKPDRRMPMMMMFRPDTTEMVDWALKTITYLPLCPCVAVCRLVFMSLCGRVHLCLCPSVVVCRLVLLPCVFVCMTRLMSLCGRVHDLSYVPVWPCDDCRYVPVWPCA